MLRTVVPPASGMGDFFARRVAVGVTLPGLLATAVVVFVGWVMASGHRVTVFSVGKVLWEQKLGGYRGVNVCWPGNISIIFSPRSCLD